MSEGRKIVWRDVVEAARIDPHTYRHEWGTTVLRLLLTLGEAEADKQEHPGDLCDHKFVRYGRFVECGRCGERI